MGNGEGLRAQVLAGIGASATQISELLNYNNMAFAHGSLRAGPDFPLPDFPLNDEPFVAIWQDYADEARREGAFETLRKHLVQLQFPIREGISESPAYQSATRKGIAPEANETETLVLRRPELVQLTLHFTPAGRIPLVIAGDREDFVSLLRAFTKRSEPSPIPASMGACIVAGFNNWDRIGQLRKTWEQSTPDRSEPAWQLELRRIIPQKELYQDRFILLSDGPYSGVPGEALHLGEQEWRDLSLTIRREHECTHYFTRRVFSSMRNNLLDEMIADYMGIVSAAGSYRAGWFLHFLGLERFPDYRPSGRLSNYRGDPPLSDGAFTILRTIVRMAAGNLESFDRQNARVLRDPNVQPQLIITLSSFTAEELASVQGADLLRERLFSLTEQHAEAYFTSRSER
ncbi:MAG: DUF7005 family protein [Bryobacteraceae bacterium]